MIFLQTNTSSIKKGSKLDENNWKRFEIKPNLPKIVAKSDRAIGRKTFKDEKNGEMKSFVVF